MKSLTAFMLRLGLLALLLSSSAPAQTISETQTDTTSTAVNCGACSDAACSTAQTDTIQTMDEGATAGTSEVSEMQSADTANHMIAFFEDADGLGTSCDAGDATTRLEITTGNTNYTVTEICVCQGTTELGAATGLSISLSAGVKTQTVTISSDAGCASNPVRVIYCGDIGPPGGHGNESVGITPSQDHDIPATAATAARRVILIQ